MKEYKAGIYLRLSSKQDEDNNSIEAQREITTRFANSKGYKVIEEYVDNGYSGILESRPALNRMMLDIVRGYINMVIVKDISRLTRNKNKTGWYTEIFFPDNDVRFISVTELIDSGDRYEIDDSIMLRGIANQYYIEDISKKVRTNKKAMKETGKFVEYYVPYGYKKEKDNKHKIMIDEEVSDNIRKIYHMYLDGKTSTQIAEYLNNEKIKTPSQYMKMKKQATKWREEQINDILKNPFYIGNTIINKYKTDYIKKTCKKNKNRNTWIIKENTHEPIILKDTYYKVQKIKQKKQINSKVRHYFLLKDLIYCGHCNRKLQYKLYKSADKKKFLYESSRFNCSLLYKKRCKNRTHIKERDLNDIVKSEVIKRLRLIKIDKIVNKLLEYYEKNDKDIEKIKKNQNEIEILERRKRLLYQQKCEKYITIDKFKIEYNKAKEEIEEKKRLIYDATKNNRNKLDKERLRKRILELQKSTSITNEFLKKMINKIKLYSKNKIEITFNL